MSLSILGLESWSDSNHMQLVQKCLHSSLPFFLFVKVFSYLQLEKIFYIENRQIHENICSLAVIRDCVEGEMGLLLNNY